MVLPTERHRCDVSSELWSFSIVLFAVVDARYNFVAVDIGAQEQRSDGSKFSHSIFGKKLRNENLGLPAPSNLPHCAKVPYVFVADEAFPLMPNLMRPYPGRQLPPNERIFNYRLSRARRIVENAFGIMAARFRVFRRPLDVKPETADFVVKACTVYIITYEKKTMMCTCEMLT